MYDPTEATTPSRHAERVSYDAASVHEILDEALVCHVGFVADDRPQVLPMLFVRVGSTVFLHGSTGARMARMAARRGGLEVVVEVSIVDALVLARSAFNHSANYRAVVAARDGHPGSGCRRQGGVPHGFDGEGRTGARRRRPPTDSG